MSDIIIKLDKDKNIVAVEGIPKDARVRILRPKGPDIVREPEEPRLSWYSCAWFVLAGRSYVKCFNEAEAKALAVENCDEAAIAVMKLEGGRKVKHEWYEPADEQPYIDTVDQDEDTLQRGAEIDREG